MPKLSRAERNRLNLVYLLHDLIEHHLHPGELRDAVEHVSRFDLHDSVRTDLDPHIDAFVERLVAKLQPADEPPPALESIAPRDGVHH